MRVAVNAILSFGLVNVPVGVAPATSEKDEVKMRVLHEECKTPIKQLKVCVTCHAEKEPHVVLNPDDLVKGFEYAKGQFVTFTDEELEAVKTDRSKVILLSKFVAQDEVDPLWVKKSYFLIPNEMLANAYGLLFAAIMDTETCGMGVSSIWGKESPCLVTALNGALMFHVLHTADEMVTPDFTAVPPKEEERRMAIKLILQSKETVEPEDLVSAPSVLLKQMVASKVQGLAFEAPVVEPELELTVDVMDALRRTMEQRPKRKRVKA